MKYDKFIFILLSVCGFSSFLLTKIYIQDSKPSLIMGITMSIISFCLAYYYRIRRYKASFIIYDLFLVNIKKVIRFITLSRSTLFHRRNSYVFAVMVIMQNMPIIIIQHYGGNNPIYTTSRYIQYILLFIALLKIYTEIHSTNIKNILSDIVNVFIQYSSFYFCISNGYCTEWKIYCVVVVFFLLLFNSIFYTCAITILCFSLAFITHYFIIFFCMKNQPNIYLEVGLINVPVYWIFIMMATVLYIIISRIIMSNKEIDNANLFAGIIAHEMRTPLISMQMDIELLQEYEQDKSKIAILNHALLCVKKGYMQIDLFLYNTRESILLNDNDYLLNQLVKEIIAEYPLLESEKKILFISYGNDEFSVCVDKFYMGQVIFNLLNNEFYQRRKHCKGVIRITVNDYIIIEDDIIGLTEEIDKKINNVFDFCYRDPSLGLGLHFSNVVIRKMGGKIKCEAKYLHYTRFIIKLKKTT